MERAREIRPKVNSPVTHKNKMLRLLECLQCYRGLYGKKKSSTARLEVQRLAQTPKKSYSQESEA